MVRSWRARASRFAPRGLSLLWSAFGASRALAYVDTSPPQLEAVAAVMPLWVPWAVASGLLALGGLVPPRAGQSSKRIARLMRQYGITITTALLLVWGAAFLISDFDRGWVSATSYIMLACFSGWSGWVASRDVADVRAVREEAISAGVAE